MSKTRDRILYLLHCTLKADKVAAEAHKAAAAAHIALYNELKDKLDIQIDLEDGVMGGDLPAAAIRFVEKALTGIVAVSAADIDKAAETCDNAGCNNPLPAYAGRGTPRTKCVECSPPSTGVKVSYDAPRLCQRPTCYEPHRTGVPHLLFKKLPTACCEPQPHGKTPAPAR